MEVLSTMAVLLLLSSEYPMAVTPWEEHVVAVALTVKGEPTVVLFAGLETTTSAVVVGVEVVCVETLRETAATHTEPEFPHAFTCRV